MSTNRKSQRTLTKEHKQKIALTQKARHAEARVKDFEVKELRERLTLAEQKQPSNTKPTSLPSRVPNGLPQESRNYLSKHLGMTVSTVASILDSVFHDGSLEKIQDLFTFLMDRDPDLMVAVNKRIELVSNSKWHITAASTDDEDKKAALLCEKILRKTPYLDKQLAHLYGAVARGVAVSQIVWGITGSGIYYIKELLHVPERRLSVCNRNGKQEYKIKADDGETYFYPQSDDRFNFLVHCPPSLQTDLRLKGLLRLCAFYFLFKQAGLAMYLSGAEKFSFPALLATVPAGTSVDTMNEISNALKHFSSESSLVVQDTTITPIQASSSTGGSAIWEQLIGMFETAYMKLFLGEVLTTSTTSTGGNRALGEVHQKMLLGRLKGDAKNLSDTLQTELFAVILDLNSHWFDQTPQLPRINFTVTFNSGDRELDQMAINTGLFSRNEIREAYGKPKFSQEQGGEELFVPEKAGQ